MNACHVATVLFDPIMCSSMSFATATRSLFSLLSQGIDFSHDSSRSLNFYGAPVPEAVHQSRQRSLNTVDLIRHSC